MSSAGVTSTTVRDFFGSTPESIKVKSTPKAAVKNEVIEAPKENLSLRLWLCSPVKEETDLEMTITPLPSKDGMSVRIHHYNGDGCDGYTKDFEKGWEYLFDNLRMCLGLQRPSQVSLSYKGLSMKWDCQKTLDRLSVETKLDNKRNGHHCEESECDGDCDEVSNITFSNFILAKVTSIVHETMEYDSKRLHVESMLKDKECPVLMEPLRPGHAYRYRCGHYISKEAHDKLTSPKMCPMCRAECGAWSQWEIL